MIKSINIASAKLIIRILNTVRYIYIYMCVCVCVCTYVRIYVYIHMNVRTYTKHIYIYICFHNRMIVIMSLVSSMSSDR